MNLIWDDELSVGVPSIDNQHKDLFDKINQFLDAMKNSKGKEEVIKTLDFLEKYVIKHFNDEETLQKKYNYPGYNAQHAQHEGFKKELQELRKTFENSGASLQVVLATQEKMYSWWRNHILKLDKDLGKYLSNIQ